MESTKKCHSGQIGKHPLGREHHLLHAPKVFHLDHPMIMKDFAIFVVIFVQLVGHQHSNLIL